MSELPNDQKKKKGRGRAWSFSPYLYLSFFRGGDKMHPYPTVFQGGYWIHLNTGLGKHLYTQKVMQKKQG